MVSLSLWSSATLSLMARPHSPDHDLMIYNSQAILLELAKSRWRHHLASAEMGLDHTSDSICLAFASCFLMSDRDAPIADGVLGSTDQPIRLVIGSSKLERTQ